MHCQLNNSIKCCSKYSVKCCSKYSVKRCIKCCTSNASGAASSIASSNAQEMHYTASSTAHVLHQVLRRVLHQALHQCCIILHYTSIVLLCTVLHYTAVRESTLHGRLQTCGKCTQGTSQVLCSSTGCQRKESFLSTGCLCIYCSCHGQYYCGVLKQQCVGG
jgi:hypothetical protein